MCRWYTGMVPTRSREAPPIKVAGGQKSTFGRISGMGIPYRI